MISFIILGVCAGCIAGFFGVGGGLILVPVLVYLLEGSVATESVMQTAIAISFVSIIFTSLSSIYTHHKKGAILWGEVKKIVPLLILGTAVGTLIVDYLSFTILIYFFIVFEILIAAKLWFSLSVAGFKIFNNYNGFSFIIGFVSSFLGIGGGTLSTPFLLHNNITIKRAIATSSVLGFPIAISASIVFFLTNTSSQIFSTELTQNIAVMILCSIMAAPIGAILTHKTDSKKLTKLFAILLFVLAISLIVKAI